MLVWLALSSAPATAQSLRVLDVPYIGQSEALCGGAAAAMVLRFWGARDVSAESFKSLVDARAWGIRTNVLVEDLRRRGWNVVGVEGRSALLDRELESSRPPIALIEDRPGALHYVVVVAATQDAVLFHDPARAPYRGMPRPEFERRWTAANRWMGIVTPGVANATALEPPRGENPALLTGGTGPTTDRCQASLTEAAAAATANDFHRAERVLASSSCAPAIVFRELGGVRARQRRWADALELASSALEIDPADESARRLSATARFVQNDTRGALAEWNTVGEPRLDTLQIDGLTRTRVPLAVRTARATPGRMVTPSLLAHVRRRLSLMPAAASVTTDFVPVAGALAEMRARVVERPLVPSNVPAIAGVAAPAIFARTVTVAMGSPTGGGDRIDVSWRYWEGQPRLGVDYAAPAPWGGVWGVGASWERQPFDSPALPTTERKSARVSWLQWVAPQVRVWLRGGADRWIASQRTLGVAGAGIGYASLGDRLRAQLDVDSWFGERRFASAYGALNAELTTSRRGFNAVGVVGSGRLGDASFPDIWFGGDTGRARPVLLRAHRLLRDGVMASERIGRSMIHGNAEGQYWWRTERMPIGGAVFVDTVWLDRRAAPGTRHDVDVGIGLRAQVPGAGSMRVDLARGLTDGNLRVSVGFQP